MKLVAQATNQISEKGPAVAAETVDDWSEITHVSFTLPWSCPSIWPKSGEPSFEFACNARAAAKRRQGSIRPSK